MLLWQVRTEKRKQRKPQGRYERETEAKGQKLYLKFLKGKFGMNGSKFCAKYSQDEWDELFEDNAAGFIKEFSTAYPSSKVFLNGKKFQKIKTHIYDFAYEYANDSGNVPSC